MSSGRPSSPGAEVERSSCAFCQPSAITRYILKETPNFRVVTDHAPLVEGHLLIISKEHYKCYGDIPASLDQEIFALKDEIREFFEGYYTPVIYWEHGVFRQTVYHAHLHCFPFGKINYALEEKLHAQVVKSQDDIRNWYKEQGPYFYMEDYRHALLFEPEIETYMQVIREVLWREAHAQNRHEWRSPQQRFEEGRPLVESVANAWQKFQEQGARDADTADPR